MKFKFLMWTRKFTKVKGSFLQIDLLHDYLFKANEYIIDHDFP